MTTFGRVEAEKRIQERKEAQSQGTQQEKEHASDKDSFHDASGENQPTVHERESFEPSPAQDETREEIVRPWSGGQGYDEKKENVPEKADVTHKGNESNKGNESEKLNNGVRETFEDAKENYTARPINNGSQALLQVPSLEASLEVIEKLVELATRYATGTEIDDHILRHVRALRESPRLLEELQKTLELMFGSNVPADAQAALGNWGLVRKLLDLLKSLGFNTQDLDFGTLLELAMLVISITKGGMSFTEIIDRITGLLSSREQQLKAAR